MEVQEIATGLWRWTAAHPAWTSQKGGPEGWDRQVGSVYFEPQGCAAEAIVLIDPLVPAAGSVEADRFWRALDRDVSRSGRPVAVLVSNESHGRSTREVYRRFAGSVGAQIHLPQGAVERSGLVPTHTFGDGARLPGGVTAHFIEGLNEPEVAFHIPEHRALVVADALIADPAGGVRIAPLSWAARTEAAVTRYHAAFRDSLRRLLELDVERLLVSHGDPVLSHGRESLIHALGTFSKPAF